MPDQLDRLHWFVLRKDLQQVQAIAQCVTAYIYSFLVHTTASLTQVFCQYQAAVTIQ